MPAPPMAPPAHPAHANRAPAWPPVPIGPSVHDYVREAKVALMCNAKYGTEAPTPEQVFMVLAADDDVRTADAKCCTIGCWADKLWRFTFVSLGLPVMIGVYNYLMPGL